jgi:cell division protein FtsX
MLLVLGAVVLFLSFGSSSESRLIERLCSQDEEGAARIEIFMQVDATEDAIQGVRTFVDRSPLVTRFRYFDKEAAFEEFKRIFRKDPALSEQITPEDLPTSFRLVPTAENAIRRIEEAVRELPGVEDVATGVEPEYEFCD